ncbi:MAG: hypothetical protein HFG20_01690 [Anaerotruncus sp.]|nr:hypothetical protein [Anaerotruncus sp.]
MASSNKTANLQLNQWVGSDKPKMADFNSDNSKIDAAFAAHTGNTAIHITAQERQTWNSGAPVFGSYVGNGQSFRIIDLGYIPSFGIIFAVDKLPLVASGGTGNMMAYCAFLSKQGASSSAFIEDGTSGMGTGEERGFGVISMLSASNNAIPHLNDKDVTYCYMLYR